MKPTKLILIGMLVWACSSPKEAPINLYEQSWIHGSDNCADNADAPIQVVQYNTNTWILRQNKCINFEAPFMFLFFGDDKALLMDTGATADEASFPLYKTVTGLVDQWVEKNGDVELIVAHTHKHGDHYAADDQFKGKPSTTVVGLETEEVIDFFNFENWPEETTEFDLGNRLLSIIPIPGHQASSIAIYDNKTKILLTGDSFYPGRLYIKDWDAFKQSTQRLVDFTSKHDISVILGNHIEMTRNAGVDYPMGTTYQPEEHVLPLNNDTLYELLSALNKLGNVPTKEIHDSFIIYPIN